MTNDKQPAALADHSEQNLEMVARWYMIDKDGMATLCTDREDAEKEAKDANMAWPHTAPHRAVQLVEAADVEAMRAGYDAARLEIESLQARIKTMAEEHADELMVAHLDGRMRAAQAAPAAIHSDLRARCVEVLAWRETGTLPGEALRTLAREKYGDRYDAIQRAERDTETEALNLVAAAPTTQPAGADRHGLPPLPDPDLRDVGTNTEDIKNFLRGYATEYAKVALAAHKQGATHD